MVDIVSELREEYGGTVRVIAEYDKEGFEILYSRDEVLEEYSDENIEEIFDDLVLEELDMPHQEDLFGDMGEVQGKIRLFEEGYVAHFWPTEDEEGLLVTLDSEANPNVHNLYETAERHHD